VEPPAAIVTPGAGRLNQGNFEEDAADGRYSIPRRYAVHASLRTSHTVLGVAFAARGSPMDLALRARLWRFKKSFRRFLSLAAGEPRRGCALGTGGVRWI
jgi:hypothetical protein